MIGADGLGLISYWDSNTTDLKVAHCSDSACTTATSATIDTAAGNVGEYSSITIGADGLGLLTYSNSTDRDLKVAHCSNTACSVATTATIDSFGNVAFSPKSITVGADGLGLISYYDGNTDDLKVAHCSDTACSGATTAAIDVAGQVGYEPSITIGVDGLGLISYYDGSIDLKVAHCSNVTCSAATTATVDNSVGSPGYSSSITIGGDGLGLISHGEGSNSDLKVTHCSDIICSAGTSVILDGVGNTSLFTSITVGADGLGLVSYFEFTGSDLKIAHCSNAACSVGTTATIDSSGFVGTYPSITIGADGLGLISYLGQAGVVKVAHLSNTFGVPYFQRR